MATIQASYGVFPPITTTTELVGNLYERINANGLVTAYRYHHFGGQRIARSIVGSNDFNYYHADGRGSVRYVTSERGRKDDARGGSCFHQRSVFTRRGRTA